MLYEIRVKNITPKNRAAKFFENIENLISSKKND
jgi:hypothetical protein